MYMYMYMYEYRFPVPDLSGEFRPPWYRTPLRTETLFMELDELSVGSFLLLPSSLLQSTLVSTQFEQAKCMYVPVCITILSVCLSV